MVTMPIMLAVFALLHLNWRANRHHIMRRGRAGGDGLGSVAAVALDHRDLSPGLSIVQGAERPDVDWPAAGVLAEVAAAICRSSAHRARYGLDARTVRAGRSRPCRRGRRCRQQSAQPDPEHRRAMGRGRNRRAICDVARRTCCCSAAKVWSRGSVCWSSCRIFLPRCSIRICSISRRLDVRVGCRCRRRDGAEERDERSDAGSGEFRRIMTAGMRARDELSAASQRHNPGIPRYRSAT